MAAFEKGSGYNTGRLMQVMIKKPNLYFRKSKVKVMKKQKQKTKNQNPNKQKRMYQYKILNCYQF